MKIVNLTVQSVSLLTNRVIFELKIYDSRQMHRQTEKLRKEVMKVPYRILIFSKI